MPTQSVRRTKWLCPGAAPFVATHPSRNEMLAAFVDALAHAAAGMIIAAAFIFATLN